ncbi:hypothetical protein ACEWY4_005434 [Coilia grayii]|uniref:Ninein n=1 Tax=Coilia grayii TaxID=363190 RepID=A0ABD1KIB3_9TELE
MKCKKKNNFMGCRSLFCSVPPLSLPVLSSAFHPLPSSADSPEVHPKFVKGAKRYGRRSTPEFVEGIGDLSASAPPQEEGAQETHRRQDTGEDEEENGENESPAVPRKRERWNTHGSSPEEYEAEGQLQLWNPDEPGTPCGSMSMPISERQEERLRAACDDLALPWDQPATRDQLLTLCQHLGLELSDDLLHCLDVDGDVNVLDFMRYIISQSQPQTPSSSTPYRQLKRHHSMQPFDESGRRTSVVTSTIGLRLFSALDDGTGHTAAEELVDAWMDEGVENSIEILAALEFSLEGRVNLSELTLALENELLMTKNSIHRAALASFKAEIRHLVERVDLELREKEKIRSDLEKAEKLKTQLASEVDEHHSAIERHNELNLRKLEVEHKEKLAALRSELTCEMDRLQQQAGQQREELEAEMVKIREDETFLREHLTLTVKENGRLERELLESTERLVEAENQVDKLQKNLDDILKEKFGDLDPGSAEFFSQEDRLRHLRNSYEHKCRELQDRIDELQAQLEEFQVVGRAPAPSSLLSLSEELESKSPGMESDQGLGPEEGQPFNMSLETEMILEQLKEQHHKDMQIIKMQVNEYQQLLQEQQAAQEELRSTLSDQHQEEVQALKDEVAQVLARAEKLQSQLNQVEEERLSLEENHIEEQEVLERRHQDGMSSLQQKLQEALAQADELQEQLKVVEAQHAEARKELENEHAANIHQLEQQQQKMLKTIMEEERHRLQDEMEEKEKKMYETWEQEKVQLQMSHEVVLAAQLQAVREAFEEQSKELQKRLTTEWEEQKGQLEERHKEALEVLLKEERVNLKEQEQREVMLRQQWEEERALLEEQHEASLQDSLAKERERLQIMEEEIERRLSEEFEKKRAQLEEQNDHDLQESLEEERSKHRQVKEEVERRWQEIVEEEKARLEESHRETMQELSTKHSEERERLGNLLDKLKDDIAVERRELQNHFSQKIKEVEARFSGDQEAVSERFQTDIQNLEQHYQSELQALSKLHAEERAKWETEMEAANQDAETQQKVLKETFQLEKKFLVQELSKEHEDLELCYKEEVEALRVKNEKLQSELESFVSAAQTKEIELSRQLNELHDRLQENLDAKDDLLTQSERRKIEVELLFTQAASDFEQQRTDLQASLSDLKSQYVEALNLAERQLEENRQLMEERDGLKAKVQKAEQLLWLAAENIGTEHLELRCALAELQGKLKEAQAASFLRQEAEAQEADLDQSPNAGKESKLHVDKVTTTESFEMCNEKAGSVSETCPSELVVEQDTIGEVEDAKREPNYTESGMLGVTVADVSVEVVDAEVKVTIVKDTKADVSCTEAVEDTRTVVGGMGVNFEGMGADEDVRTNKNDTCTHIHNEADTASTGGDVASTEAVVGRGANVQGTGVVHPGEDDIANLSHAYMGETEKVVENTGIEGHTKTVEDMFTDIVDKELANAEVQVLITDAVVIDTKRPTEEVPENRNREESGGLHTLKDIELATEDETFIEQANNAALLERIKELEKEVECMARLQEDCALTVKERDASVKEILELQDRLGQFYDQTHLLDNLKTQCKVATKDNHSLQQQVYQLQQRNHELQLILEVNNESLITGQDALVENCGLRSEISTMIEQAKDLEINESHITGQDTPVENSELRSEMSTMIEQDKDLEIKALGLTDVDKELANAEVQTWVTDVVVMDTKRPIEEVPENPNREESGGLYAVKDIELATEDETFIEQANNAALLERIKELEKEVKCMARLQEDCASTVKERDACVKEILELQDRLGQFYDQTHHVANLKTQCKVATKDNHFLQQQVYQLQQRNHELQAILEVNSESLITGQDALVENCELRSEISTMIEQAKDLEIKALELTDLQIRYEECICENVQLANRNEKLEKRVMILESKMHIIQDFHDQHSAFLDEIERMREENANLSSVVHKLEKQDNSDSVKIGLHAMQQASSGSSGNTSDSDILDFNSQLGAVADLEECCFEFERQNAKLRRALTELQDKSFQIHSRMQAQRNEAGRLAEENLTLRRKISAIKEEESRENMLLKLDQFRKEKVAAQKVAESLKKQISELRARSQQLEGENKLLSQENTKNAADVQKLSVQLTELIQQSERREAGHQYRAMSTSEEDKMMACVSSLEAELRKAQKESAVLQQEKLNEGGNMASAVSRAQRLEEEKALLKEELDRCVEKVAKLGAVESQLTHLRQERQAAEKQVQSLRSQLSKVQEKNQALESTLQVMNLQTSRLKSDLRVTQQERDSLKQDVMSLHQKLQNANDKVQLLEVSLQASGFPAPQRQLLSGELRRLLEKDQHLLQEEKERLLHKLQHTRAELQKTREKSRQLESSVVGLKQRQQQSQVGLLKVVEQEKASLKRELDALRNELLSAQNKVCEHSAERRQLDTLRQENAALKNRQTHLEAQLFEAVQVQLGGMLPQSPVRLPGERRGQHHGDDHGPDFNIQDAVMAEPRGGHSEGYRRSGGL